MVRLGGFLALIGGPVVALLCLFGALYAAVKYPRRDLADLFDAVLILSLVSVLGGILGAAILVVGAFFLAVGGIGARMVASLAEKANQPY